MVTVIYMLYASSDKVIEKAIARCDNLFKLED